MNTVRHNLVKRLRIQLREACAENPAWKRQAKNAAGQMRVNRFRQKAGLLSMSVFALWISFLLCSHCQLNASLARLLLGVAAVASSVLWMGALRNQLWTAKELVALRLLPVSDEHVFRRQLGMFFRRTVWMMPAPILGLAGAVSIIEPSWNLVLATLGSGVALNFVILALAVVCTSHMLLARIVGWITTLFWFGFFLSCVLEPVRDLLLAELGRASDWMAWLLPTSWVVYALHHSMLANVLGTWLAVGLVLLAVRDRSQLHRTYKVPDWDDARFFLPAPSTAAGQSTVAIDPAHVESDAPVTEPLPACLVEFALRKRDRKAPADFLMGLIWKWWTPRERRIAEWGISAWPPLGKRWVRAVLVSVTALALAFALPHMSNSWLIPIGLVAASLMMALPLMPLLGRTTDVFWMGAVHVPRLMLMPVTLAEILSAERKVIAVRMLAALPVIIMAGVSYSLLFETSVGKGIDLACRAAFAVLGVRAFCRCLWLGNRMVTRPVTVIVIFPVLFLWLFVLILVLLGIIETSGVSSWTTLIVATLIMEITAWLNLRFWSKRWTDTGQSTQPFGD